MAKIKLTPGQLYFLRERDFLTRDTSRYVKIGLVRDIKETQERIREHQTGNPREIYDYCSLESPFVEHLETLIHYWFAPKWITGEWFDMTDEDIENAIDVASLIIDEQNSIKQTLEKSYELANLESNGKMISSTDESTQIWEELIECKVEIDRLNANKTIIKHKMREALGSSGSIEGVTKISIKAGTERFNERSFAEEHPDLYTQFCTKESTSLSSTFTLKGKKSLKNTYPEIDSEKKSLQKIEIEAADIVLGDVVSRSSDIEALHSKYIDVQRQVYINDWKYTQLEARLKVLSQLSDGIDGQCGWKRELKSKMTFDKKAFEEKHPEIFAEHCFKTPNSFAVNIFSWRAY